MCCCGLGDLIFDSVFYCTMTFSWPDSNLLGHAVGLGIPTAKGRVFDLIYMYLAVFSDCIAL